MSLLDPRTHETLLSAWRENRLLAVHIDLQGCFYPDDKVCAAIKNLSNSLRSLKVENAWVAYADESMRFKNGRTTVKYIEETKTLDRSILPKVGAQENEAVLLKHTNSALIAETTPLQKYLDENDKDTLLITGVNYDCCVGETIQDAILSGKYNIIAVADCINIPMQTRSGYECYARDIYIQTNNRAVDIGNASLPRSEIRSRYMNQFHVATSGIIVDALSQGVAAPDHNQLHTLELA
jgi:nicotinamidase-related amidase